MSDLRSRLDRLERQTAGGDRCPVCGAHGAGAYADVAADGTAVIRCLKCSGERPHPGGTLKGYAEVSPADWPLGGKP